MLRYAQHDNAIKVEIRLPFAQSPDLSGKGQTNGSNRFAD